MRNAIAGICMAAAAFLLIGSGAFQAGEGKKPKHTIKQVMKEAHKGKGALLKKLTGGTANADDKEQLIILYTSLSQNKPPKGDAEAFAKRTKAILAAAKAAVKGDEKALKRLAKATNCGSCHKQFK